MHINKAIIEKIDHQTKAVNAQWIAVTKMRPVATLMELYLSGKKEFGENKAQELCDKFAQLPKDIQWHFIGHLQTNKVKSIIDKVVCIHAVDSEKLLVEIEKEAAKINKKIQVFIQIHVALEETKYGFSHSQLIDFFRNYQSERYPHIEILGLMAMASMTDNQARIRSEFEEVKKTLNDINSRFNLQLKELSMGMSGDYEIALDCGATYIRIGSILFE